MQIWLKNVKMFMDLMLFALLLFVTIQTLISLASGNPVTPAVGQRAAVELVLLNRSLES